MKNFDQFRALWYEKTRHIKIKKETKDYVFVVVYPDKLEWDFSVEKQTQTTCVQTSGGSTGAGTGHNQILCYQSELYSTLRNCTFTHAMIVSVGMVFDMVIHPTSITSFLEFVKDNYFCKAHIIAHRNKPAFLHHQHIELNLDMWKEYGSINLFKEKWDNYVRSEENFHDDYTPPWIFVPDLPEIKNFSARDRRDKSFSYYRTELQNKNWRVISSGEEDWRDKVDLSDNYFKTLFTRVQEKYYVHNTENIGKLPDNSFDLIVTPTAGYSGEYFANHLDFDGEVIFYDYCKENLEIKKMIVDMNMSIDEIRTYAKTNSSPIPMKNFMYNDGNIPHVQSLRNRVSKFGDENNLRKLQEKMTDNFTVTYLLMNIISDKNNKELINKIKDRKVFFDISNIFGYHMSHLRYTFDELNNRFETLCDILETHTKYFYLKGTRPSKDKYVETR